MTIKNYLIEQGNGLIASFKDLKLRISYSSLSNVHFIEVHPGKNYNDEIKLFASYILDDFYESFPSESLSFITSSDFIERNVDDIWLEGANFKVDWSFWLNQNKIEFSIQPVLESNYALVA